MQFFRKLHHPPVIIRASRYASFNGESFRSTRDYIVSLKALLYVNANYSLTTLDVGHIRCALDGCCPEFDVVFPLLIQLFRQTPLYIDFFRAPLLRFAADLECMDPRIATLALQTVHESLDSDLNALFFNTAPLGKRAFLEPLKNILLIGAESALVDAQKAGQALLVFQDTGLFISRALELLLEGTQFRLVFDGLPELFSAIYSFHNLQDMPNYYRHLLATPDAWKHAEVALECGDADADDLVLGILHAGDQKASVYGQWAFDLDPFNDDI